VDRSEKRVKGTTPPLFSYSPTVHWLFAPTFGGGDLANVA